MFRKNDATQLQHFVQMSLCRTPFPFEYQMYQSQLPRYTFSISSSINAIDSSSNKEIERALSELPDIAIIAKRFGAQQAQLYKTKIEQLQSTAQFSTIWANRYKKPNTRRLYTIQELLVILDIATIQDDQERNIQFKLLNDAKREKVRIRKNKLQMKNKSMKKAVHDLNIWLVYKPDHQIWQQCVEKSWWKRYTSAEEKIKHLLRSYEKAVQYLVRLRKSNPRLNSFKDNVLLMEWYIANPDRLNQSIVTNSS